MATAAISAKPYPNPEGPEIEQALADEIDKLSIQEDEKEAVKKWIRESSKGKIEILITGRTGAGKSTLVNSLVGKPVAEVGNRLEAKTKNVTGYRLTAEEGVEVVVWDSPGLQDGSGNEEEYLAELKEKCSNVDIVIYCIKLAATRSDLGSVEIAQNDFSAIQKLTVTFGPNWWKHSIFVMTHANALEAMLKVKPDVERRFNARLKDWKGRIHAALLAAGVSMEVKANVNVVPAGHVKKPHLPGAQYWLSRLWFVFMNEMKERARPKLIKMNAKRLTVESKVSPGDFKKEGHKQPIVVDKGAMALAGGGGMTEGSILTLAIIKFGGVALATAGATAGLVAGGGLAAGLLGYYFLHR